MKSQDQNDNIDEEVEELWDADPSCKHEIIEKMSGIACKHCNGWYCL
jgi:hypothetical protein